MKKSFILLGVMLCFIQMHAQTWKGISPETLKRYDYVCLKDSTSVEVNDNGSGSFHIHQIIEIKTPKGALAHRILKYDYDPLTAHAIFQSVTVRKANGDSIQIPVNSAVDYTAPARAIYWGARQIMIELGQLEPGDTIDYVITKKGFTYALLTQTATNDDERFIPPMRGEFYDIVPFWCNVPTARKVYRVAMPDDKDVQYEFYQGEAQSSIRKEGNKRVYTFAINNQLPFAREANMVDLFDVAPKLMMSTTPTWNDKSAWFYKVNEDYGSFEAHPEAQKKVNELLKGKKDEMEKIAILTHWVADNMRYSGISMGKGEGYTLHNTAMNFTDRCGVCKDKAALLISMLRMAGFEAYPAMTMAGSRVESIPADHFNHSVTVVKLSNGTYMPLDPTWVPFVRELWSSAEQQQNYLPGVPETSDLMVTPISPADNHYFTMDVNAKVDNRGTLHGTITVKAEGQSDATVRRPFMNDFKRDWHLAMEKELMNIAPQAELVSVDYGNNPYDYVAAPIKITMKFRIPDYALLGDDMMVFTPISGSNFYKGVQSHLRIDTSKAEKEYAFTDRCSRLVKISEQYNLPQGYKMSSSPANVNYEGNAASYKGSVAAANNSIRINHDVRMEKRVYDASDWKDVHTVVSNQKQLIEQPIIIHKAKH
ncbi:MAG: DUF3857 domain-containing transglutaminase family protein [Marinifilaceae bacterium]